MAKPRDKINPPNQNALAQTRSKWHHHRMATLPQKGEYLEIDIEGMDDEARGRGTIDQRSYTIDVAVRGAFVGDRVKAKVEKLFASRQLAVCRVVEHIEQGPCHVERTCPHKGPCPACPLHGADLSLSLELKRGRIEQALQDEGLDFEVDDVLPHPEEFGYRQKVKLMIGGKIGNLTLGLYVPYSHHLVAAHACPYVNTAVNEAAALLLEEFNKLRLEPDATNWPGAKALILRAAQEGVAAVLVTRKPLSDVQFDHLKALVDAGKLVSIAQRLNDENTNNILAGSTGEAYGLSLVTPLEGEVPVDPDSFCQTDAEQARIMYDLVAEYLTQDDTEGWFADVYAGVGGFSEALLEHGAEQIIAIEEATSCRASLEQLEIQVEINSTEQSLTLLSTLKPLSGIVVDPPKKGLRENAEALAKLHAPRFVLVSCDPDAMVKDLKVFLREGYEVERILPVDLFGGSPAIETLVFLRRP
jgi:23S rRNA (uracil1939-C5)-methyltransferase